MSSVINVCFCFNDAYAEKVAVLISSILFNNKREFFHFYLLSSDLTPESIRKLEKISHAYKNYTLHSVWVDKNIFNDLKLNIPHITVETYFRYVIADLIPNVDKILYLDADTVIAGNIAKLYNIDLGKNYLAGCKDKFVAKEAEYAQLFNPKGYINAGVLLINTKIFRENHLSQKLIKKTIDLQDKTKYLDQDILNAVCSNHILIMDSIYNFAIENIFTEKKNRKKAVVIHYTGPQKPWNHEVPMGKIWQEHQNILKKILKTKNKLLLKFYLIFKKMDFFLRSPKLKKSSLKTKNNHL